MSDGPWVFELLRLFDGDACDELRWRDDGPGLVSSSAKISLLAGSEL